MWWRASLINNSYSFGFWKFRYTLVKIEFPLWCSHLINSVRIYHSRSIHLMIQKNKLLEQTCTVHGRTAHACTVQFYYIDMAIILCNRFNHQARHGDLRTQSGYCVKMFFCLFCFKLNKINNNIFSLHILLLQQSLIQRLWQISWPV